VKALRSSTLTLKPLCFINHSYASIFMPFDKWLSIAYISSKAPFKRATVGANSMQIFIKYYVVLKK